MLFQILYITSIIHHFQPMLAANSDYKRCFIIWSHILPCFRYNNEHRVKSLAARTHRLEKAIVNMVDTLTCVSWFEVNNLKPVTCRYRLPTHYA